MLLQLYEAFQKDDQQTVVYAISMSWFREWENFVKGKSDCELSAMYQWLEKV